MGVNPTARAAARTSSSDPRVHGRVGHQPASLDILAAGLELRLDQGDHVAVGRQARRNDGQNLAQRDERDVDGDHVEGAGQVIGRQIARVDVLAHDDARVGAQAPVELPVAHVERDHLARAALQQHVGEAAGGRADVERERAGDVDAERVERVRELQPAAADVRMIRHAQRDVGIARRR